MEGALDSECGHPNPVPAGRVLARRNPARSPVERQATPRGASTEAWSLRASAVARQGASEVLRLGRALSAEGRRGSVADVIAR
jgi:hypothetical protein